MLTDIDYQTVMRVARPYLGEMIGVYVFSRIRHRRFAGGKMPRTQALILGMWYCKLRELI
ncbi:MULTISPECIES: hypothetical protein [Paraburkholderia]|uniref:hypothetical protein n=1 Tax=Paraburkholderia TaxID=1822464 RepID=UPI00036A0873|nr:MULTISPECIES: hypothetical protein [Paraburkholderia]MDH6146575.1 hypothetical protein [Paraburkholderia sp. WSM4179]